MKTVEIYTKGYCPFCHHAKALLTQKGVTYREYPLENDPNRRAEMVRRAPDSFTVPQIFIGNHHIGGSDELVALERAGKLDGLLN